MTERRKALTEVMATLKNSLKVLQRDPDISANTIGDDELEAVLRDEAMKAKSMGRGRGGPGPGRGGGPGPGPGGRGGGPGPGGPGHFDM